MPNSKKKKKTRSPKFKKENNQPDLKKYVGTPQINQSEIKKRTPPNMDDPPAKKLNLSQEEPEEQMDTDKNSTMDSDESVSSDGSTSDEEKVKIHKIKQCLKSKLKMEKMILIQ